jgi:hypothetical protein
LIKKYVNKYAPKNIDKFEAQNLYDSGLSIRKLAAHYNVCQATISRLNLSCRSCAEGNKLSPKYRVYKDGSKESLSNHAKKRGLGGYRPHPNKGQYYNEIWFDSTWEVRVAESLDENLILWERPRVGFGWSDNRRYYPDFYLPEFDIYLDPKNPFLQKKDKIKIDEASLRNNIKVFVLNENQLTWKEIKALIS